MPSIEGGGWRNSRSSFDPSPANTSRSGEANAVRAANSRTYRGAIENVFGMSSDR